MSSHALMASNGSESGGSRWGGRTWDALLIFAAGIVVFTVGLPQEFIGLDARYALFAKEMLRNGPSVFPTTYLGPYPDYPATIILPIYWLAELLGRVTPLAAALPTAIVSAGILVLVYKIAALHSRKWGCCAVCLMFLTFAFLQASRRVSPDQYTTLVTAACFYVAYSARELGMKRRLWSLPVLLILGYACRGPIGLIVPGGVLCTFYFFNGQVKAFSLVSVVVLVLLAACSAALLAAAEHQGGRAFAERVLASEALGRMNGGGRRIYYYWTTGFVSCACVFPLAVLSYSLRWKRITAREDADSRLLYSLAVWTVVVLVGLSIPGEKKTRYILPIVPPMALIAAHMFVVPVQVPSLMWTRRIFLRLCAALPFVAGIGCACRGLIAQFTGTGEDMFYERAIVCTALAAGIAFVSMRRAIGGQPSLLRALVAGAMSLCLIHMGIVEPVTFSRERSGPFVERIEALQKEQQKPIVFYRMGPDQEDIAVAANLGEPMVPKFIATFNSLLNVGSSSYVVAGELDVNEISSALPSRLAVLGRGQLAGERCAVFTILEGSP